MNEETKEKTLTTLMEFTKLPIGYDGFNAVPVSLIVVNKTLDLVDKLVNLGIDYPNFTAEPCGNINIEWNFINKLIEIVVSENELIFWTSCTEFCNDEKGILVDNVQTIASYIKRVKYYETTLS